MLSRVWGVLGVAVTAAVLAPALPAQSPPPAPPVHSEPVQGGPADASSSKTGVATMRPVSAAAVSAANEQKLHEAFDSLYNLDFKGGLEEFEGVAQAEPRSATVRAFWASGILYEIMAHQGSLQSQLFVTTNAFLRRPRTPVAPELDQRFHEVADQAENLAKERLKANPNDADGLFALGLTYGLYANYLAGVKAEYYHGVRAGEKAYDYMKKLRDLRPEIHDAAVVLGIHDYILGSLPTTTRFLLFFVGARGNKDRGKDHLQEAASYGEYLRTYAQILLGVAWIREEQLDRALPLAEDLVTRYPSNPIFRLELARLYRQTKRFPQANQACRDLLADLIAHPHNPRVIGPEDALLELGRTEEAESKPRLALESLRQVGQIPGASKMTVSEALLERGKLLDLLGKHEQARGDYEQVIKLNADPDDVDAAKRNLKTPYQAEAGSN